MPLLCSLPLIKVGSDVGSLLLTPLSQCKVTGRDWLVKTEARVRKEAFVSCQRALPTLAGPGVAGGVLPEQVLSTGRAPLPLPSVALPLDQ